MAVAPSSYESATVGRRKTEKELGALGGGRVPVHEDKVAALFQPLKYFFGDGHGAEMEGGYIKVWPTRNGAVLNEDNATNPVTLYKRKT